MDSISKQETSTPEIFSATLVHFDGVAEVVLVGELDMGTIADLEEALRGPISNGAGDVVLNLSGLSFMDSSGIGALVRAHDQLQGLGRRLIIRSPKTIVAKALELTNLTAYMNVVD